MHALRGNILHSLTLKLGKTIITHQVEKPQKRKILTPAILMLRKWNKAKMVTHRVETTDKLA